MRVNKINGRSFHALECLGGVEIATLRLTEATKHRFRHVAFWSARCYRTKRLVRKVRNRNRDLPRPYAPASATPARITRNQWRWPVNSSRSEHAASFISPTKKPLTTTVSPLSSRTVEQSVISESATQLLVSAASSASYPFKALSSYRRRRCRPLLSPCLPTRPASSTMPSKYPPQP